jgi:hypothetical protein
VCVDAYSGMEFAPHEKHRALRQQSLKTSAPYHHRFSSGGGGGSGGGSGGGGSGGGSSAVGNNPYALLGSAPVRGPSAADLPASAFSFSAASSSSSSAGHPPNFTESRTGTGIVSVGAGDTWDTANPDTEEEEEAETSGAADESWVFLADKEDEEVDDLLASISAVANTLLADSAPLAGLFGTGRGGAGGTTGINTGAGGGSSDYMGSYLRGFDAEWRNIL